MFSAQFYRAVWWVLALRCALPLPLRLPRFTPTLTVQLPQLAAPYPSAANLHTAAQNSITAEFATSPAQVGAGVQQFGVELLPPDAPFSLAALIGLATVLWFVGAMIILCWRFGSYALFMRQLRKSRRAITTPALLTTYHEYFGKAVPLYSCKEFRSPSLTGFFRKAVYLPSEDIPPQQLAIVLQHERCHARRHDLWLKGLLVFSTAFCWFNPLVWWMARAAEEDIECACDEVMLQGKSIAFRQEYGRVLLHTLRAGQQHALSTSFAGNARQLHHRFEAMYSSPPKNRQNLCWLCFALLYSALRSFSPAPPPSK